MSNPPQEQSRQPGREHEMVPKPDYEPKFRGAGRLSAKVALITGGDSGIGRATGIAFAREGANVAFVYLEEEEDAAETVRLIEREGGAALAIRGDVADEDFCRKAVAQTVQRFGGLNILVNNAAEQHVQSDIRDITRAQLERTFATNVFGYFFMAKAALDHLSKGDVIINTTSITAYKGQPVLIDYSATRGAVLALTRSLSQSLAEDGIRVNGVAPGPIWTPLIPASFDAEQVKNFGQDVPLGRPGQPNEVAAAFVFLASPESSYVTGQVIHVNGGTVVAG